MCYPSACRAGSIHRLLHHPFFWILLTALLAMGGALWADFYMDDFGFILNRNGNAPQEYQFQAAGVTLGSQNPEARVMEVFQILPTLMSSLTNYYFPMNAMAAHGWNLLIHVGLALLVFGLGRNLLVKLRLGLTEEGAEKAALVAALIFACHPLATEPVHYAKCHMVALVALFGFMATAFAVDFLWEPTPRKAVLLVLATGLCVVSYFPGTVMVGLNLSALVLFSITGMGRKVLTAGLQQVRVLTKKPAAWLGMLAVAVFVGYAGNFFLGRFFHTVTHWDEYFSRHVATQGRVFWEYAQRMVVPVGLCSDHYQPWSTFQHPEAVVKLGLMWLLVLGLAGAALWPGQDRRRGFALLGLFTVIPFAMRLLYVNSEIMVEYRAYNALPWFCLLAGVGLSAVASRLRTMEFRLPWLPAAAVVIVFMMLSMVRSQTWRSSIALAEDSLAQYPMNNRARNQLQYFDFHSGRYAAVLEHHDGMLASLPQMEAFNKEGKGAVFVDELRTSSNVISSFQFSIYARAEMEGRLKALEFADRSLKSLQKVEPGWFSAGPRGEPMHVTPLLEAKAAVDRMAAHIAP